MDRNRCTDRKIKEDKRNVDRKIEKDRNTLDNMLYLFTFTSIPLLESSCPNISICSEILRDLVN